MLADDEEAMLRPALSRSLAAILFAASIAPTALSVGCRRQDDATRSAARKRPHVLLIVLDTTRADFLSSYGFKKTTTPEIDRLAAGGTRFTRAFATDFWTLPSHASLLTGLYPLEAQATSETNHLPERVTTLAESLQQAGYHTGAVVCNSWISKERGFGQGFADYDEVWRGRDAPSNVGREQAAAERAAAWIGASVAREAPFFLFVNFNLPHLPFRPPRHAYLRFESEPWPAARVDRLMNIAGMWAHLAGAISLDEDDFRIMRDLYAAEVATVDGFVGRLVAALNAHGVLDDTLVIVTADHGENIGDHGMIDHLLSMYESTIHVPLVVRFPKRFRVGAVDERLVSLVDVVPTVLDVCGLTDEPNRSGVAEASLCSERRAVRPFVWAENERPVNGVQLLQQQFPAFDTGTIDRPIRMFRTDRHKLIWYVGNRFELYDLTADPAERTNLADREPQLRETLFAAVSQWMASRETPQQPDDLKSRDTEAIESLRALGYID